MDIVKEHVIKLEGEIMSNSQGVNKLMQYYEDASQYRNTSIIVDCYNMDWIDANLAAFLHAIDHRLLYSNNLTIKADFEFLAKKFGVLFRNGWLQHENYQIEDVQKIELDEERNWRALLAYEELNANKKLNIDLLKAIASSIDEMMK